MFGLIKNYFKDKELKRQAIEKQRQQKIHVIEKLLKDISKIIEDAGGEFILGSCGSGDIDYELHGKRIVFNQFHNKFNGFKISQNEVSFVEVMQFINKK